jgi:chromosome segregation ATPase
LDSSEAQSGVDKPHRKSKIEKIRQLQAKNELYKEEFKRVQKDRKKLKKELEVKSNEIAALTKEIDLHIEETSRLKSELAEALIKIERGDDRHELGSVSKLSKEMTQAKDELAAALRRVSTLKDELADMKEFVRRKDEQIESLSQEVSSMETEIVSLREQKREMLKTGDHDKMVNDLVEENRKLQSELGSTLDRATAMVKEREDAISDLLKENDELKALLLEHERAEPVVSNEEFEHLQKELHKVTTTLEGTQDRNVLLEEEIEAWLGRGSEMESMLDRLNSDLETWQEKARKAESTIAALESQLVDAKAEASSGREALRNAEAKYKADLEVLKSKHENEMKELQERVFAERIEKQSTESPQAMLLQQAVSDRMKKSLQSTSWRKFLKAGDDEESLDDNQKRIKELEAKNAEQEQQLQSLRSEMVRLRSSFSEAAYVNKKKIDQLTDENAAYEQKVKSLEEMLSCETG